MTHWVPELLAPAGSFDKGRVALEYGADAIYLAGQKFGLRQAADNFTPMELASIVAKAHQARKLVYVVINSFLHDEDLEALPEFLSQLEELKVDALIVSDLGVIKTIQDHCKRPIHLSTQASCLNSESAKFWRNQGVTRLVLGRETSLQEAKAIKEASGLEIELFIHGSMCMAYSGNCVISNYTQGRDSNRGGCAHSCRFDYTLDFSPMGKSIEKQAYFMSSKDLEGLKLLPQFIDAKIDSLKVEGRMKSPHYAGTVSKVYSEALDFFRLRGTGAHVLQSAEYQDALHSWLLELSKVTQREATEASLVTKAGETSIFSSRDQEDGPYHVAGIVLEALEGQHLLVEVRHAFTTQSTLELVPFKGPCREITLNQLSDLRSRPIEKTKPGQVVRLPWMDGAAPRQLIRQVVVQ
jgi:U32 family peptidase